MTPLNDSPFSRHFILLTCLGAWILTTRDPIKLSWYAFYKVIMSIVASFGSYMLLEDLVLSFGDFKKLTWNLCISTLFIGSLLKNVYCFNKSQHVDKLRWDLHKDVEKRTAPKYLPAHNVSLKQLKYLDIAFYFGGGSFATAWISVQYFSYIWGPKEWPVPFSLPFKVDTDDDYQYNIMFLIIAMFACFGLWMVVEQELAMFTILIQLAREYRIFLKDITQLNDLYADSGQDADVVSTKPPNYEINPDLREAKAKMLVRQFSTRQQELIQYTETFEFVYSQPLLLQFAVSVILVVVSLIQCIIGSGEFSIKISYQLGYSIMLLLDMFLMCILATKLNDFVAETVYSTFWYAMSIQTQKDILLILMRAQRPPKITSGKIIVLNLHAFMILIRNVYSWLTLFQQLEFKV